MDNERKQYTGKKRRVITNRYYERHKPEVVEMSTTRYDAKKDTGRVEGKTAKSKQDIRRQTQGEAHTRQSAFDRTTGAKSSNVAQNTRTLSKSKTKLVQESV